MKENVSTSACLSIRDLPLKTRTREIADGILTSSSIVTVVLAF